MSYSYSSTAEYIEEAILKLELAKVRFEDGNFIEVEKYIVDSINNVKNAKFYIRKEINENSSFNKHLTATF